MMSNTFYTDNSAVLGLFSNIIITSDSKRLCFINLNANNFFVLNIRPVDYDFSGNILIIKNISETIVSQIEVLISKGVVYKLFDRPIKIADNKLHNIPIENILENKTVLSTLFLVTIVLDTIPELPTLFYPPIKGIKCRTFSGASLRMNDIRSIIPQLQGCKKIRLLGKDIFKHDFIHLPEFNDIKDDLRKYGVKEYFTNTLLELVYNGLRNIAKLYILGLFDDLRCCMWRKAYKLCKMYLDFLCKHEVIINCLMDDDEFCEKRDKIKKKVIKFLDKNPNISKLPKIFEEFY